MTSGVGRMQTPMLIALGLSILGIALSSSVVLTGLLLFIEGMIAAIVLSTNMALVQLRITDDIRGRVLGAYSLGFGLLPVAALPIGFVADVVNTQFAIAASATLALILSSVLLLRARDLRSM